MEPKVLLLVPCLRSKGGVANYYRTLGLEQVEGVDYFEVSQNIWGDGSAASIPFHKSVFRLARIYLQFVCKLAWGGYALVHSNPSLNRRSFWRDSIFVGLARLGGKRTVVFFRGWDDGFEKRICRSPLLRWVFLHTFGRANMVIVLGQLFARKLTNLGVPEGTTVRIESTIAADTYIAGLDLTAKLEKMATCVNLLFLSRLQTAKGLFIAIDAFHALCRRSPQLPVALTIAGDGPQREEAIDYVANRGLSGVTFIGYVGGADKDAILRRSHMLVLPTYYGEGMPNSILEAMLYGLVIVTRPVAGIPDHVKHRVNGFLLESLEPSDWATAISELISDGHAFRQMSAANHLVAAERFTPSATRKRILGMYGSILGEGWVHSSQRAVPER